MSKKITTEELYRNDLITEFFNTHYFKMPKDYEQGQEIEIIDQREYLDFIKQKVYDKTFLFNFLADEAIENESSFGKVLELNTGVLDSIAKIDRDQFFDITVVSKYGSESVFGDTKFDYYNGELASLNLIGEGDSCPRKLYLKYYETKKKLKQLSEFDTIINVNPEDPNSILDTYLYSVKHDINSINGYVINLYDKFYESKNEVFSEMVDEVNAILGEEVEVSEVFDGLSKIRVMSRFKNSPFI